MPQELAPGKRSLIQNFDDPTRPKHRRLNFELGKVGSNERLDTPPEIADPMKANELNLPEFAAEAGVGVPALDEVDADEVEPEVKVKDEVMPAVSPCQSSSSSWGTIKEEGRDMMIEGSNYRKPMIGKSVSQSSR